MRGNVLIKIIGLLLINSPIYDIVRPQTDQLPEIQQQLLREMHSIKSKIPTNGNFTRKVVFDFNPNYTNETLAIPGIRDASLMLIRPMIHRDCSSLTNEISEVKEQSIGYMCRINEQTLGYYYLGELFKFKLDSSATNTRGLNVYVGDEQVSDTKLAIRSLFGSWRNFGQLEQYQNTTCEVEEFYYNGEHCYVFLLSNKDALIKAVVGVLGTTYIVLKLSQNISNGLKVSLLAPTEILVMLISIRCMLTWSNFHVAHRRLAAAVEVLLYIDMSTAVAVMAAGSQYDTPLVVQVFGYFVAPFISGVRVSLLDDCNVLRQAYIGTQEDWWVNAIHMAVFGVGLAMRLREGKSNLRQYIFGFVWKVLACYPIFAMFRGQSSWGWIDDYDKKGSPLEGIMLVYCIALIIYSASAKTDQNKDSTTPLDVELAYLNDTEFSSIHEGIPPACTRPECDQVTPSTSGDVSGGGCSSHSAT